MRLPFSKDSFLGQLFVTLSGLSVAQLLPILAAPALARCFDAEQFGVFAVFYGLSSILAIAFTGKMDAATVASSGEEAAHQAFAVGLLLSVGGLLLGILIVVAVPFAWIQTWLPEQPLAYLLLFTAFAQSLFYLCLALLLRYKDFQGIAWSRVGRTIFVLGLTFLFFFAGYPDQALILGVVVGQFLALLGAVWQLLRYASFRKMTFFPKRISEGKSWFLPHAHFLWFATPAAVLNSTTFYLPVFFLNSFVGEAAAGYFGFVQRTVGVPVGIVASSLADVYRKKIAELYTSEPRAVLRLLQQNIQKTAWILLPLLLLAYPLVKPLVPLLFGEAWLPIIPIIYIFLPVYAASILVGPFSTILHVIGQQKYELLINLLYISLGISTLSVGIIWLQDWLWGLLFFAGGQMLIYVVMISTYYRLLKKQV